MDDAVVMGLVHNAALLLLIVYLYDLASARLRWQHLLRPSIPVGLALGLVGIAVMMTPLHFGDGVIYDTRSVLLGICGLFFGAVPTTVAMAMTSAFRAYLGGSGMWTGIAVILASGGIGLVWRHFHYLRHGTISIAGLCLFGLVVNAVMLLLQLSLPDGRGLIVLPVIGLPVLTVYSTATLLLGCLILQRLRHEAQGDALQEQQAELQALYTHAPVALWKADWSQAWLALQEISNTQADLRAYFVERPGEVWRIAALVRILEVNDAALVQAGVDSRGALFGSLDRFLNEAGFESFMNQLVVMASGTTRYQGENDFVRVNGEVRRLSISLFVLPGHERLRDRVVVSSIDITERARLEEEARHSLGLLRNLTDQVPGVIFQYQLFPDGRSCFPYSSAGMSEIYGMEPELVRTDASAVFKLIHPDDLDEVSASIIASAATLKPWQHEYRVNLAGRGECWLSGYARPQRLPDGSVLWHGYIKDVTERKRLEVRLNLASHVFEAAGEAILVTDAEARIVAINLAFTRVTGYTEAEVLGKNPRILSSGQHDQAFYENMWKALTERGTWSGDIWNRRKSGEVYPEWLSVNSVLDVQGHVQYYVAVFSDLSEIRFAQSLAERRAREDSLTGLANRTALIQQTAKLLNDTNAMQRYSAVVLVDIGHFKELNEGHGQIVGDQVLKALAEQLLARFGDKHMVARVGADEFALLLGQQCNTREEAGRMALEIVEQLQAQLGLPLHIGELVLQIHTHVGIAVLPDSSQENATDILQQAEWAASQAKLVGDGVALFFQSAMGHEIRERYRLEQELRLAVDGEQLRVYLQPQFDGSGRQVSAEALIRWQHPVRGLVPPGMFIPLAESSDLIFNLERWMLREVSQLLVRLAGTGKALPIAVNVSVHHFESRDFVEQVRLVIAQTGVDPAYLVFEITESIVIENVAALTAKMLELAALGIHFSMDDFGTGYSSLSYLKRLPIHELKIDRSFIMDAPSDANDAALVETILGVARTLGLRVVAEGVETQAHADFLKAHGDVIHQGYLYDRPMPVAEWLDKYFGRTS